MWDFTGNFSGTVRREMTKVIKGETLLFLLLLFTIYPHSNLLFNGGSTRSRTETAPQSRAYTGYKPAILPLNYGTNLENSITNLVIVNFNRGGQ